VTRGYRQLKVHGRGLSASPQYKELNSAAASLDAHVPGTLPAHVAAGHAGTLTLRAPANSPRKSAVFGSNGDLAQLAGRIAHRIGYAVCQPVTWCCRTVDRFDPNRGSHRQKPSSCPAPPGIYPAQILPAEDASPSRPPSLTCSMRDRREICVALRLARQLIVSWIEVLVAALIGPRRGA